MSFISQKIQKNFQNQFRHNQVTLENIKTIRQLLEEQPSPDTLIHRLKHWQGEQNLYIKNYLYWVLTTLSLIFLLAGLLFSAYYLIVCVALFGLSMRYRIPTIELEKLKEELRLYILEQNYQVRFDHENTPLNHALQNYPLFQFGDRDNLVTTLLTGQMMIKEKTYDYSVIKYHYAYSIEKTDEQGRTFYEIHHSNL